MEFTANTAELSKAVNTLGHVVSSRGARIEYSYIAIHAKDSVVRLEATDGIIFMSAMVGAAVTEDGACALDGKMLTDVIRKQPGESVSFSVSSKERITIRSGKAKAQLAVKPLDDFPDEPALRDSDDPCISLVLPVDGIIKCISSVEYAVSADTLRPVLCGILLEISDHRIRAVAIDGFRMAMLDYACDYEGTPVKMIIPRASAAELVSLLSSEKEETIRLDTDGERLIVNSGSFVFNTSLTVGEYINYERAAQAAVHTRAKISCRGLREAVERSMIVARSAVKYLVTLCFDGDGVDVSSKAEDGETTEKVDADLQGEPIRISFNGAYLMDALKQAGDGDLEIGLGTPVSPATIRNIEKDQLFNLLLPVRTFN